MRKLITIICLLYIITLFSVLTQDIIAYGSCALILGLVANCLVVILGKFIRPRLENFPECGTRAQDVVDGADLCMFDCEWRDSNPDLNITERKVEITINGETLDIYATVSPSRVPKDINCLNDCPVPKKIGAPCPTCLPVAGRSLPLDFNSRNSTPISQEERIDNFFIGKKKSKKRKGRSLEHATPDDFSLAYENSKTPWLCSLKYSGFRGRHRCGVVLLSAYPKETILVSAAHCNNICKDMWTGNTLEPCCCREIDNRASCRNTTSYCGNHPIVDLAKTSDLEIVCGEFTTEAIPEYFTPEKEVVLKIDKITQHPSFGIGKPGSGGDIAVYHVSNPKALKDYTDVNDKSIYPACLPTDPDLYDTKKPGRLVTWMDPEPSHRAPQIYLDNFVYTNHIPKTSPMIETKCKDPDWMGSNTYYPRGTVCYKDDSERGCITFGNSGSPLVRLDENEKFHWVGSLSISKGCDKTTVEKVFVNRYRNTIPVFNVKAENPAVFTDGLCYLDWIADQYGMKPPLNWVKPSHCLTGEVGDANDKDKEENCMSSSGEPCDFKSFSGWDKCLLVAFEGYSYNIFMCKDKNGKIGTCANNCKGVDPNYIVVGGAVIALASGLAGSSLVAPAVGVGTMGGIFAANGMCPPGQCKPRNSRKCCSMVFVRRRLRCPRSC